MSLKSATSGKYKVAYVEDEDDNGNLNNRAFATSTAGSPQTVSAKMNISRKKSSPKERQPQYHESPPFSPAESSSAVPPSRRESKSGRSSKHREPSVPPQQSRRGVNRPDPPKHSNTAPAIDQQSERRRPPRDQPHYYDPDIRSQSRPRSKTAAPRPSSLYGAPPPQHQQMHPPAANNRYHMMHPGGMAPPPPSASAIPRGGFAPPPPQYAPPPQGPPMHQQHWQPQPPPPGPPQGVPYHGPSHSFGGYGMVPPPPMRTPGLPSHHDSFQMHNPSMPPPAKPFDIVGGGRMMPPPDPFPMGSHTPRSEPFGIAGHSQPHPPRDLHQRFARPQTSMGHRPPPPPVDYDDRDYEPDLDLDRGRDRYEESLSNSLRRLSMGYKPRYDEPSRTMSARPQASPFMPPPALPPARDRSTHRGVDRGLERLMDRPHREHRQYDDRCEEPDSTYYENSVPYDEPPVRAPRHRRESIEPPQYSYESRPYATEIARTSNNRRESYYGESNTSSAFEDKMRLASSYQEDKGGGMRLTADLLHESERDRHGPRSRSTRSSGSRDESDWRQSATTRTTRTTHTSNNEDDDLCIRVRNGKVLQMQYGDGTGITINHPQSRHYEPSMYGDDERQSRYDRPAIRSRAASRAGSIYAPPANEIEYSYGGGDYSDESPFAPREHNRYIRDH